MWLILGGIGVKLPLRDRKFKITAKRLIEGFDPAGLILTILRAPFPGVSK